MKHSSSFSTAMKYSLPLIFAFCVYFQLTNANYKFLDINYYGNEKFIVFDSLNVTHNFVLNIKIRLLRSLDFLKVKLLKELREELENNIHIISYYICQGCIT